MDLFAVILSLPAEKEIENKIDDLATKWFCPQAFKTDFENMANDLIEWFVKKLKGNEA